MQCSFCGKDEDEVEKILSGFASGSPNARICNECVVLYYELIREDLYEDGRE